MGIQTELNKGRVPVEVWTRAIEPDAIRQPLNVASLPIVHGHVAAMPDVHAEIGATVSRVGPTPHGASSAGDRPEKQRDSVAAIHTGGAARRVKG